MTVYKNQGRRSIRLPGTDYTVPGLYFITICTRDREHVFGEVVDGEMALNELGNIVRQCWEEIPNHFKHAFVDEFIVMPNHIHGIIVIGDTRRGTIYRAPTTTIMYEFAKPIAGSLATIIGNFKAAVTRNIKQKNDERIVIWQRNYFEHIIRNDQSLNRIRRYIRDNPLNWDSDPDR